MKPKSETGTETRVKKEVESVQAAFTWLPKFLVASRKLQARQQPAANRNEPIQHLDKLSEIKFEFIKSQIQTPEPASVSAFHKHHRACRLRCLCSTSGLASACNREACQKRSLEFGSE